MIELFVVFIHGYGVHIIGNHNAFLGAVDLGAGGGGLHLLEVPFPFLDHSEVMGVHDIERAVASVVFVEGLVGGWLALDVLDEIALEIRP